MKCKIKEAIDEGCLLMRKKHDANRSYHKFHPSEIGGCLRQVWYRHKGEKGLSYSPITCRIFGNGHKVHERLVEYLKESTQFQVMFVEKSVEDEFFTGSVDCIGLVDGESVVVDFKSLRSYPFTLLLDCEKEIGRRYIWQAHVYMHLTKCRNFYLIYENKDNQAIHIERVGFSEDTLNEIYERAKVLKRYLDDGLLPAREKDIRQDWECSYCEFKHKCYSEDELTKYDKKHGKL